MSDSDSNPRAWLAQALELAHTAAAEDEVPVGAVVIHEGKVVGRGYNLREKNNDPIAHAEILAIRDAATRLGSWRLTDCELWVTLEPCPMCLAACQQARVSRVFYGAKDPKGGALSLGYLLHQDPKTNHRFEVSFEEDPACGAVLSGFFAKKRKQK
jgi:tRNA(adenine34) deaminase